MSVAASYTRSRVLRKRCTKCHRRKALSRFSRYFSAPDGLQYHCKTCNKKYAAQWYKDNKARVLVSVLKWRSLPESKIKLAAARHRFHEKHKSQRNAASRTWW